MESRKIERRKMDWGYGKQAKYSLLGMTDWFADRLFYPEGLNMYSTQGGELGPDCCTLNSDPQDSRDNIHLCFCHTIKSLC
jgi:hypothetical protein